MTLSATSFKLHLLNGVLFVSGILGFLLAIAIRNNDMGLAIAFMVVTLNLVLVSQRQRVDLIKSITCLSLGFFFEYLNMNLGFYHYEFTPKIPPVWMLGLWPIISTLFFGILKNFSTRSWWVILISGLPICIVHISISAFERIQFSKPQSLAMVGLSLILALEFLLVVFISKKLDDRPEISRPKS